MDQESLLCIVWGLVCIMTSFAFKIDMSIQKDDTPEVNGVSLLLFILGAILIFLGSAGF